jgi:hypothetical protein
MRKMGAILLTAGFPFFLFLHHPHKRLENISIFLFSSLQLSSQKAILWSKKYLRGICTPPSLLPLSYANGNMKLTTHLHPVPRLRMSGAIYLDPPTCLHGAESNNFMSFTITVTLQVNRIISKAPWNFPSLFDIQYVSFYALASRLSSKNQSIFWGDISYFSHRTPSAFSLK